MDNVSHHCKKIRTNMPVMGTYMLYTFKGICNQLAFLHIYIHGKPTMTHNLIVIINPATCIFLICVNLTTKNILYNSTNESAITL